MEFALVILRIRRSICEVLELAMHAALFLWPDVEVLCWVIVSRE